MHRVGIICDINYTRHHLFQSYFHAVKNLYEDVVIVKNLEDLKQVADMLFIGDDHYAPHKEVWMNDEFITYCNGNKIRVVALTNEKILNSYFPWNKEIYNQLSRFEYLVHYANDVEDCHKLGLRVNRTAMSRSIIFEKSAEPKIDRAIFVGNTKCKSYRERVGVIEQAEAFIPIDVLHDIPTWSAYMRIISRYRFVFSPIGNGNFFPMRFYEALAVGSIPIHQVRSDTLDYYTIEREYDDCIFFKDIDELRMKLEGFSLQKSHNVLWMEDNLTELLTKDKLL